MSKEPLGVKSPEHREVLMHKRPVELPAAVRVEVDRNTLDLMELAKRQIERLMHSADGVEYNALESALAGLVMGLTNMDRARRIAMAHSLGERAREKDACERNGRQG